MVVVCKKEALNVNYPFLAVEIQEIFVNVNYPVDIEVLRDFVVVIERND